MNVPPMKAFVRDLAQCCLKGLVTLFCLTPVVKGLKLIVVKDITGPFVTSLSSVSVCP